MSNVYRTRTHAAVSAVAAAEQQPEGWRFVPDTISAWVSVGPPVGPGKDTPRYTGARSAGRPWVARTQFSTQQYSAETRQTWEWSAGNKSTGDESLLCYDGPRNEEPIVLMHEDFQLHVGSDWVGDLLERKNTTGVIARRGMEERVLMTSENKTAFETNCETNEYFPLVHQYGDVDDCRTYTWITWDVRRWCFTPQRRLLRMMEHERWDRVFSATSLEMKQINDWLNLERARSSSARV